MLFIHKIILFLTSFILSVYPTSQFTEGVVGQPRTFFPSQISSQSDKTISSLVYRGLFKYDIYGTLQPDLAETWEISDEGLVYTIKIKDNQYWTDGRKITSDDLIYTAFKTPDLQGVATDKVDERTVRYTLPNKFSPFLSMLTTGVMQQNSEESYNPLQPVTNGKFRIVRVEKSGPVVKEVILWNTDSKDNIKRLTFRYYANEAEVASAARLGEVEGFLARDDYNIKNFTKQRYPLQGVYYALYFNLQNDKLKDLALRQKMAKVLPVQDMIVNKGIYVQGPISRSIFTDNLKYDQYDKAFPKEVNNTTITITVPDIEEHVEMANTIADYWENMLGMEVNINAVNPETFTDTVINTRNYEVLLYGQEVGRDPDRYVNWHSTQKAAPGLNLSGFDHVRADRALEEGRKETDFAKRQTHYNEFQKVIAENVPAIFLYHPYENYYVSKYIEGIGEKYTFTEADRFLDFSNWKLLRAF